jgi:hypothetical protein
MLCGNEGVRNEKGIVTTPHTRHTDENLSVVECTTVSMVLRARNSEDFDGARAS